MGNSQKKKIIPMLTCPIKFIKIMAYVYSLGAKLPPAPAWEEPEPERPEPVSCEIELKLLYGLSCHGHLYINAYA